jgi:urease accessory protein
MESSGIAVLREAGSSKCRVPRGSPEAILINTSGGLAGGDFVSITAEAGADATLSLSSQAAERVYRSLGPAAEVKVRLSAAAGATLFWMPQETIFYEGSVLDRTLDVNLAEDATFLAAESLVFGRTEMGEVVRQVQVSDQWRVSRGGKLIHAEAFRLGSQWKERLAQFGDARASATVLLISKDAEALIDRVHSHLGPQDGVSAWNGKLVARLLARDGFTLRKTLIQVLRACVGARELPKTWTF